MENEALVQAIMETSHTVRGVGPGGPLDMVLTLGQVRDLVEHGKGEATLGLCRAYDKITRRVAARGLDTPAGAGDEVEAYRG